jgi:hypothetical protein
MILVTTFNQNIAGSISGTYGSYFYHISPLFIYKITKNFI